VSTCGYVRAKIDSRALLYADLRAELARVRVPTLVMQGDVELSAPIEIIGRRRPP
jgi:hypothetical protein